jgi:hypothetical protein
VSLRVLTWHVHGSYLQYLSAVPVTWLLPVRPDRQEGYGGRGATFHWPDNVVEVPADDVPSWVDSVDVVLTQSRHNWEVDRHELLGPLARDLPRVHIEHDPPRHWPNAALHPVQDPTARLVHVTPFNALMWDSGITPSTVVEHGVDVPKLPWTGEHDRGITVVNNLWSRGRRLGPDVFEEFAGQVPLDLAGMGGERWPSWLGDVRLAELHRLLPSYRFFFNPIRYTSLGLAVCEAMALGLPVLGLATTEMATAVQNGVNGYVETRPDRLVAHARRLLEDPVEAAELSAGAVTTARERFGHQRFVQDWSDVLHRAAASTSDGVSSSSPGSGSGASSSFT